MKEYTKKFHYKRDLDLFIENNKNIKVKFTITVGEEEPKIMYLLVYRKKFLNLF